MANTIKFVVSETLVGEIYLPIEGAGTLVAGNEIEISEDLANDPSVNAAILAGMLVQVRTAQKFVSSKKSTVKTVSSKQSFKQKIIPSREKVLNTEKPQIDLDVNEKDEDETVDFIDLDKTKQQKTKAKAFAWDLESKSTLDKQSSKKRALNRGNTVDMDVSSSKEEEINFNQGNKKNKGKGRGSKSKQSVLDEIL